MLSKLQPHALASPSFLEVGVSQLTHLNQSIKQPASVLQRIWGNVYEEWPVDQVSALLLAVPVAIGFAFLLLILCSFFDCTGRKKEGVSMIGQTDEAAVSVIYDTSSANSPEVELAPWSMQAIAALTSYRFYTGFLNATWMPYLLAMEGHELMEDRQSMFMGITKLIYGCSVLLNPLFGLLGDQSAAISHWSGRRLFILVGVAVSALGIYGCLVASHIHSIPWYLTSTVLWMLGEAMADVTTETLVPELLPRSQYELSSAIRALNFLLGGLAGYAMLIVFRHVHYSWIYYGYLVLMILCAGLSLVFIISAGAPAQGSGRRSTSVSQMIAKAYIMPTRVQGGFPRACLCMFVFSLGSAPMFFLLLMIRDIVGVYDPPMLQMHFSVISIVFFVCAACASSVGAVAAYLQCSQASSTSASSTDASSSSDCSGAKAESESNPRRWPLMVFSTAFFAVVCATIPMTGLFRTYSVRVATFYTLAAFFGCSFGSVYARFQDCTWSLIPSGADIANLMGFAAMAKLIGIGIGNFVAGLILDSYTTGRDTYEIKGYVVMCFFCATMVGISAVLAWTVGKMATAAADQTPTKGEAGYSESRQGI